MRHSLASKVALPDHLHLCRGGMNLDGANVHHAIEQLPGTVRLEFEQGFIHRDDGQFRVVGQAPAIRRFYLDPDLCRFSWFVYRGGRFDAHIQSMRFPAYLYFGIAQTVSRLAEIGQCRGRRRGFRLPGKVQFFRHIRPPRLSAIYPSAHCQHRNKDVGCITSFQGNLNGRRLAAERRDEGFGDAFAFDRHPPGGFTEGHANLESCCLSGLVFLLFGNEIDSVCAAAIEPGFFRPGEPDTGYGGDGIALPIFCSRLQEDFPARAGSDFAV